MTLHKKIKSSFQLLLLLLPGWLYAQETIKGTTTSSGTIINFTAIAKNELKNPPKPREKKSPNHAKIKPVIANFVDPSLVPPFIGKLTSVALDNLAKSAQNPLEFPCNNFNALDDDGNSSPPDVNGAIGFDHIMTTLNTQIRIQNKQGGIISTVSLNGFWNGIGGYSFIFDPKITYDPYEKRWIFICCADNTTINSASSALLLAVSQTSDPTGNWNTYNIDADPGNQFWFDYPSIGFNRNWITVGGYMFNLPGQNNAQRSRVWVINKSDVYAGLNTSISLFDRTDYFHIAPAITYSPTENTIFCVSKFNSNFQNSGFVRLFSITGTAAAPVFNVLNTINVGPSWNTAGVNGPQLNSNTGLDLGDDRILQTVFRNGVLWFGNNVFLPATAPTTCASQIVAINPVTQTAIENIRTAADANNMTAYPSVAVNQRNDLFFGYSTFSSTNYVRASVSYRRSGEGFFFYHYKAGEDWYVKISPTDPLNRNRWGDYSATFIDPEDDITAWTIQEYARPRAFGVSFWGTWWAKICPGFCTNDFSLTGGNNNVMQKYEANNIITSSVLIQNNSFIKYDAGTRVRLLPGFRVVSGSKFNAYIEGCGGVK